MKNSLLKARSRIVNFRITEEEYETLHNACIAHGARCISDFAREAALRRAGTKRDADIDGNSSSVLLDRVATLLSTLTEASPRFRSTNDDELRRNIAPPDPSES